MRVRALASVGLVVTLGFTSFAAVSASGATPKLVAGCASVGQGAIGPAVATLQGLVKTTADGEFGPMTKAAVVKWQKRHDVDPTGVVDAATWDAMPDRIARTACSQLVHGSGVPITCAHLRLGSTGTAVAILQKSIGVDVDGEFGPLTQAAVSAAQTKAKLPVSGKVGPATWAALALTGTPACMGAVAPAPAPKQTKAQRAHAKAVQAITDQVTELAAALLDKPAGPGDDIALRALSFAMRQKGKPYAWGGTGPKSYDCSGLVMTSYLHAGFTLPRVAADQYGAGKAVPLDQAEQGDLLFYASDVTQPATIYHVVMYAGGGNIIDAPYTGAFVGTRPLWTRNLLPVAVRPVGALVLPVKPGATGWTVTQLQQELDRHGAALTVDGGYGARTVAAVKAWKVAHKMHATAVVGRDVWLTFGAGMRHVLRPGS